MNFSKNMKGWNEMEKENTYGRKVVRDDDKVKKMRKAANRNFKVFTFTVLIIGTIIGAAIMGITHHVTSSQTSEEKNTEIMQEVRQYGAYDGKTITEEPSMDWVIDDSFVPLECDLDEETQEFTYYLCKGYDIDWVLVMALMQKESSFDAEAISPTNDYGLMQINKANHQWLSDTLGITDFLDKEQNIRAGVFVLRKLFEQYGDETDLVLMAYNMGCNGAETLWNKGIYTTPYVDDIRNYQQQFNNQIQERMETNGSN